MSSRQAFDSTASQLGLTSPQARLVLRLWEPTPMRVVADHLACDASNVTGIASRLIERGLITATPGEDRRIRLLQLTPDGRRLRAALERHIARASPAMARLSGTERQHLIELLDKLAGAPGAGGAPMR